MEAKVNLFDESDICAIYSIQFSSENIPEFQKFLERFEEDLEYRKDYEVIINAITRIFERGAQERYFRPEGKFADRVCALPIDSASLRIYCIRLSDHVLIVGNGGIKKGFATYQESDELRGYVLTLQKLDELIKRCEREGKVKVSHTRINGIEDINFEL